MEMLLIRPRDPHRGTVFTRVRTLTLPSVAAEFSKVGRVRVVDEGLEPIPDGHFDLIGVTTDTTHSPRAYILAEQARKRGAAIIMGGTHPSAMPDEALEHCDSVVIGEVEGLAEKIAADLSSGRLAPRYHSLRPPDLSNLPIAPVDLLPEHRQLFKPYPIELTRGCRHSCRFCFNRYVHGRGFRRRNLNDLVEAIRERKERRLLCMDDNLVNDPEHLGAFAELVAPLGRTWGGQSTIEIANDRPLLRLLKRSGFCFTFIGLESLSPQSLAGESKTFNDVTLYREQFQRLREHGIVPFAGVIVGLDGDGPDMFRRTHEALRAIGPAACAFTMPVAYPGTAFYRQMEAEGRIICHDRTLYDGHHVALKPARMSCADLRRGYHGLAASFFSVGDSLRRFGFYGRRRMNMPRLELAASYAAITVAYRHYHKRLANSETMGSVDKEVRPPLHAKRPRRTEGPSALRVDRFDAASAHVDRRRPNASPSGPLSGAPGQVRANEPPVSVTTCNTYHPDEVYRALRRCLDLLRFAVPPRAKVLIKPNAMTMNRPEQATGTHHAVLEALCRILADNDCAITIGDSSAYYHTGYTRRSFETLGFTDVARRYGARLICFEEEPFRRIERAGSADAPWLYLADLSDFDLVINIPKLKVHRVTRISGAVKNLFGLVPGGTKPRYHELLKGSPDYLERFGTLLLDVYLHTRPGLSILDGIVGLERDGPAATGDPRRTRFLLASHDALALDFALCQLIGEDPGAVPYLRAALRRRLLHPEDVHLLGQPPKVQFRLLEERPRPGPLASRTADLVVRHLAVRPCVDRRLCQGCGECAERCLVDAISLADRGRFDMQRCIHCYGCPAYCRQGAIYLAGSPLQKLLHLTRAITGM
ncbi:DUF362 domain-containing protein [Planctomycetota bacterium]